MKNTKIVLRPWKKEGEGCIILMHNFYGYKSNFVKVPEQKKQLNKIKNQLAQLKERVQISWHPRSGKPRIQPNEINKSKFCVGWHTNALCEVVLKGIPIVCFDQDCLDCVVWSYKIDNLCYPDRHKWLNYLCYAQWSMEEIKQGLQWNIVEKGIMNGNP